MNNFLLNCQGGKPFSLELLILIWAAIVWSAIWKGVALWRAGKNGQLGWFVALFLINTVGILEIIYLSFFQKKQE